MAKVTFTSDIKIKSNRQTFPKLSGLKNDEKVRIQLMSTDDIDMEFVHNLEIPILDNGKPVYKDDGKLKKTYKGSPLSFGDVSILEERGIDPKNCPISKLAKEHPDWVSPPKRKFAMHILQYRTKPGSFELATPFSVEHKVWVFTEKTFLKLREFVTEWENLKKHDLYITCTNEKFQQYDITVAPKAGWLTTGNRDDAILAQDTYNAGKETYPDLSLAIGSRPQREWLEKDLEEIEETWNIISGKGATSAYDSDGLDGLLDTPASPSSSPEADVLTGLADAGDTDSGAESFEDLLKGL